MAQVPLKPSFWRIGLKSNMPLVQNITKY